MTEPTAKLSMTDHDGDTLEVTLHDDGQPVFTTTAAGVELTRAQVVELHRTLGWYLERTEPCQDATPADSEAHLRPVNEAAPATILEEAQAAVYGDRQEDYGHPREDFTRTAIIWTGLLHHKLADGEHLEAADIARCQIGVKLARDVHAPKRDNRVDMAGYALTLDRLETGR